jgi:hypothetical protein
LSALYDKKNQQQKTGLYSGDEMDSSKMSDKEKKMAFLDKAVNLVGQAMNTLVEAKPAKVSQHLLYECLS